VLSLTGCRPVPRQPSVVRHVEAKDLSVQHPMCLQSKVDKPPQAIIIRKEADWKTFWGPGEDPPVINFEKDMVFVASASVSSEGPGTLQVWALKFVPDNDVTEVQVKEVTGGEWPLSAGFSRAYEIVKLPQTGNPVMVVWRRVWGNVDETKELQAREWTPQGQGQGWGQQQGSAQQGWGGQQQSGGQQGWGDQGQQRTTGSGGGAWDQWRRQQGRQ